MILRPAFLSNAVVGKEFRTRMRGWRSIFVITGYMIVLGLIAIAFLIQQAGPSNGQSSQVGTQLLQVLAVFQLLLILFVTPASTAGAISGERQRQTWDLLLVTRLSAFSIVWGKLIAGLAFNVLLLFASLPLLSLVFLFGGVAPEDVLHIFLIYLSTVLFLGAFSLLISVLTRRLAISMIVSNLVALFLGVALTLLAAYLENWGQQTYVNGFNGPPRAVSSPPLTPLAQIDPVIALASALPNGTTGKSFLGDLGTVHHFLGLHVNLPLWGMYCILSAALSVGMVLMTTGLVHRTPRWLGREAA